MSPVQGTVRYAHAYVTQPGTVGLRGQPRMRGKRTLQAKDSKCFIHLQRRRQQNTNVNEGSSLTSKGASVSRWPTAIRFFSFTAPANQGHLHDATGAVCIKMQRAIVKAASNRPWIRGAEYKGSRSGRIKSQVKGAERVKGSIFLRSANHLQKKKKPITLWRIYGQLVKTGEERKSRENDSGATSKGILQHKVLTNETVQTDALAAQLSGGETENAAELR